MSILPDVIAADLDIVFCGTAAGAESARRRAYYAGPGNAFWRVLYAVELTPRRLEPEEYAHLLQWRLGLTDLAKEISGNDVVLSKAHFDTARLRGLLARYRPRILAFTGKRAAREFLGGEVTYGLMTRRVAGTRVFVLPSPSGAACRYWDEAPWRELARLRSHL